MQQTPRRAMMASRRRSSRITTEMELRSQLKQVEAEMAEIGGRVKSIDLILNERLAAHPEQGWKAAVDEYLGWLDRVEALGLAYVNGNIVTQRLRLVYEAPLKPRGKIPDPAHRMKEVKSLLDAVRHTEQSNLLLLRARRHTIVTDIQGVSRERKSAADPTFRDAPGRGGARSVGWLQILVLLLALLAGRILLDAFRPEITHFVRSHAGLQDTAKNTAP
jgi:hypothetical protein